MEFPTKTAAKKQQHFHLSNPFDHTSQMTSPPQRPLSGSGQSPPRPPESPTEVLYNTAVQSFVRRDHVKTHSTLTRLLSNLKGEIRKHPRRKWYDLSPSSQQANGMAVDSVEGLEEWLIKTYKLHISAHASLYTDPPRSPPARSAYNSTTTLPSSLLDLIPPHPPNKVLQHVYDTVTESYPDGIIPPPLISTFILAGLKLQPQQDALGCIHKIAEEWLANLPDTFIEAISAPTRRPQAQSAQGGGKRLESGREGYLRVLELFTGEVLVREGEWEMARGVLDGDTLLGSKRKEALYRHLRATQTRREAPSSASSSGILSSPSGSMVLPDKSSSTANGRSSRNGRHRSRSSSTSSSEATARPVSQFPLTSTTGASKTGTPPGLRVPSGLNKGKARETETDSESTLPSRIVVNPPSSSSTPRNSASRGSTSIVRKYLLSAFSPFTTLLTPTMRKRLWAMSTAQLASLAVPLPLFIVLFILAALRKRRQRQSIVPVVSGSAVIVATAADDRVAQLRARLRAVRNEGLWDWVMWFLRWWIGKVAGVWKLGTTISYL